MGRAERVTGHAGGETGEALGREGVNLVAVMHARSYPLFTAPLFPPRTLATNMAYVCPRRLPDHPVPPSVQHIPFGHCYIL